MSSEKLSLLISDGAALPKAKELVPALQQSILDGNNNPLKTIMFFKKMGKIAEELIKGENGKKIQFELEQEFIKYNEKGSTALAFGNKIVQSNRKYFDFSECNDPIWDKLTEIQNKTKELLKTREAELKLKANAPAFGVSETSIDVPYIPKLILHPNTDLAFINPPKTGSKTSYAYHV